MESAPEVISNIIIKIFPPEIAYGIIIMGFMIFFLCFYGTKEWKSFSDLEKIIFSIFTGALVWYLFIFPLAMGYETLKIVFTYYEDFNIVNNSVNDFDFISRIIVGSFAVARILSKLPLFNSKKFLKLPELIGLLVVFMYLPLLFVLISFNFSVYRYFNIISLITYPIASGIIFLIGLDFVLIKIIYYRSDFKRAITIEFKKIVDICRNRITIMILLLLVLISITAGYFYYNPSVVDEDLKIVRLEIPILPIEKNNYENLSGSLLINDQFKLKFGLIKWAYISKNFTITEAFNSNNTSKKFDFFQNLVILRGDNLINVTLIGNQRIDVDSDLYNIEINNTNNLQIWNISFNKKEYEIEINKFYLTTPNNLKLIQYSNYDDALLVNKDKLNAQLNKSYSNHFTINDIKIPQKYEVNATEKATLSLYFIQQEENT